MAGLARWATWWNHLPRDLRCKNCACGGAGALESDGLQVLEPTLPRTAAKPPRPVGLQRPASIFENARAMQPEPSSPMCPGSIVSQVRASPEMHQTRGSQPSHKEVHKMKQQPREFRCIPILADNVEVAHAQAAGFKFVVRDADLEPPIK